MAAKNYMLKFFEVFFLVYYKLKGIKGIIKFHNFENDAYKP